MKSTAGLLITDITQNDATSYDVTFNGAATRAAGTPGSNLEVNGQAPSATAQNGANTIRITVTGPTAADLPWQLNGQPPWISQAVSVPQNGVTLGS